MKHGHMNNPWKLERRMRPWKGNSQTCYQELQYGKLNFSMQLSWTSLASICRTLISYIGLHNLPTYKSVAQLA